MDYIKFNTSYIGALALLISVVAVALPASAAPKLPIFDDATFTHSTTIDHPLFSLPIGTELHYKANTDEGAEEINISVTGATKSILGVTALVYHDQVFEDGELTEDTHDYVAQDDAGNIWYLGEDVDNYEGGKVADHEGAWLAGEDGAKPGYWLPADPMVGDVYYQEYQPKVAEDQAEVVSTTTTVTVGSQTYDHCLKTKDTSALEPDVLEYKYYCPEAHTLVLEEEDGVRTELTQSNVATVMSSSSQRMDDEDAVEDQDEPGDIDANDNQETFEQQREHLISQLRQLLERIIAMLQQQL